MGGVTLNDAPQVPTSSVALLERKPQEVAALQGRLLLALGPDAAMAIKRFLELVSAHQARTG